MNGELPSAAVSIVMPVRSAAATLGEALDSIFAQEFREWELIAVDDHSTDESVRILEAVAVRDRRIRILPAAERGLVQALNRGLAAARCGIIARMDADDVMTRDRLELQRAWLEAHPRHDLVGSLVRAFPDEDLTDGMKEYIRWINGCVTEREIADQRYIESPFAHPSVMFRREAVEAVGGYCDGDFPEDYDLWLRMLSSGAAMGKVPQVLLHWRESAGRASRADSRYVREKFDLLRASYLAGDERLRSGREVVFWGAGRRTRRRSDLLIAKGVDPSAYVDVDPRKIGRMVGGRPVVPPSALAREPRPFVLVYVANHGARELISAHLGELGYEAGADWIAVG